MYLYKPYQQEREKSAAYTEVFFGTKFDMVSDVEFMN